MNKFLTKIIGASLAIAMMIGVGINTKKEASLVSAESPASLTFGAACGGSGTDSDGNTWTVTSNASESNFDSARGIHYGTNSASVTYVTLSTNGFTGTINTVVVNASDARGTAVAYVTVGETTFTCSGSATVTNSNPGHDYSFTGSATGSIVVDIRRPSSNTKAIYVKSVTVSYTSNGGEEPQGGGRGLCRACQHGRVCDGVVHGELGIGRDAQPLRPYACPRRQFGRQCGGGRRESGDCRAGYGYGRLDSSAREFLQHCRREAQLWTREPFRGHGVRKLPRPGGADDEIGRGCGDDSAGAGRA